MFNFKKSLITVVVTLCTASAAFASAIDKNVLTVGTHATFPPFEFHDEKGAFAGYDIDLVEAIGAKLGKKIEWVDMAFDGLLPSILTGKIDIIAACMSATPARAERISFSEITNKSYSAFFVLPGNEKENAAAFNGKKVAIQLGSIQDVFVNNKMENVDIKAFKAADECLFEVLYGRVDAALVDGTVGYKYMQVKEFAGKIVPCAVTDVATASPGAALGMNKNDTDLQAAVNAALLAMKESGEFQALRDKWHLDDWKKNIK